MSFSTYDHILAGRTTTPTRVQLAPDQVRNDAGGFVFEVDPLQRVLRFLILGSEGGSYYAGEQKLTLESIQSVRACLGRDQAAFTGSLPHKLVDLIVDVSKSGRAMKNDPAVMALAICAGEGDLETRPYALARMPEVCRIGTDLFHFVSFVQSLRGWGRGLKRAVADWYTGRSTDELALQLTKYQQRDGISHRDVLRLAHARFDSPEQEAAIRWTIAGTAGLTERRVARRSQRHVLEVQEDVSAYLPRLIEGFEQAKALGQRWAEAQAVQHKSEATHELLHLIQTHGLQREHIPTVFLNSQPVWEALLYSGKHGMPMNAMVRNLGKMTAVGLITQGSEAERFICSKLQNPDAIRYSRLHPMRLLMAAVTYGQGRGDKGSLTWTPTRRLMNELTESFYLAFGNVPKTGKAITLGIDVSGSMDWPQHQVSGCKGMTSRMAAAAMALVQMNAEPENTTVLGFSTSIVGLCHIVKPSRRIEEVVADMTRLPFGGTDIGVLIRQARQTKRKTDLFVVYTDNQDWAGPRQVMEELRWYRWESGIERAKLASVCMAGNRFTVADPKDPYTLDVVGFDTNTPSALAEFATL